MQGFVDEYIYFLIILHNLGGNSPVDTTDTLWVKHFVKTALSHIISKINALYAEIQDGLQQMVGKRFPAVSAVTLQVKNFVKITLPRTISKINAFCILHRNSRWPPKCGKRYFWGNSPVDPADTLRVKTFVEVKISPFLRY